MAESAHNLTTVHGGVGIGWQGYCEVFKVVTQSYSVGNPMVAGPDSRRREQ